MPLSASSRNGKEPMVFLSLVMMSYNTAEISCFLLKSMTKAVQKLSGDMGTAQKMYLTQQAKQS